MSEYRAQPTLLSCAADSRQTLSVYDVGGGRVDVVDTAAPQIPRPLKLDDAESAVILHTWHQIVCLAPTVFSNTCLACTFTHRDTLHATSLSPNTTLDGWFYHHILM